ncbi:MAG: zinc-binding dehydrogenase [Gammaproteobacteria bacterium]|nr:zinc-binding dehydrogenase [Gammaproteobacteria bacterium]
MTAHRCGLAAGDPAGKTLLVTGAGGRVGHYAVQWAKLGGARVIATAGTDDNCRQATQAGADEVLNYREDGLAGRIAESAGSCGIDHIVDVEFGLNASASAEIINNCGTIATYSSSRSPQPEIPFYPMMFKNVTLYTVLVYNMPDAAKRQAIGAIHEALAAGLLAHRISAVRDLADAAKAHELIEAGEPGGCILVRI